MAPFTLGGSDGWRVGGAPLSTLLVLVATRCRLPLRDVRLRAQGRRLVGCGSLLDHDIGDGATLDLDPVTAADGAATMVDGAVDFAWSSRRPTMGRR